MAGYGYNDLEPKEKCPYCGTTCHADFVDVGVAFTQCGPYHCDACGASEIGPCDENEASPVEISKGWYSPGSAPGSTANVDEAGRFIPHYEADTNYRASVGVPPRYDNNGRLLSETHEPIPELMEKPFK